MLAYEPLFVAILFLGTVFLTLFLLYRILINSTLNKKNADFALLGLSLWIAIQMVLSYTHFYSTSPEDNPPKFALLVAPPLLFMLYLFLSNKGRRFIDSLSLKRLTELSVVRIPVEIVLYFLAIYQAIPEVMTFEGANFDILAGFSSLLVLAFVFKKEGFNRKLLLIWNIISMILLINIVVIAVLSAPFSFQQISFSKPNLALLYFPYALLPGFVVPVVLFSHIASLRKLLFKTSY